ncbi:c-type cytochrome [Roseibium sp.]|uniref:c-type cytochrome n=1 Tax=Roseibium sp. TaxID=1936156 RepID=UPI003A973E62
MMVEVVYRFENGRLVQQVWRCLRSFVAAGMLAVALATVASIALVGARAADVEKFTGDPAKGQAFAEEACAGCHAVGTTGDSALSQAPQFRQLSQLYPIETLAEALAEGIVTAHPDMPEVVLEPEEIEDFLSYLQSIQTGSRREKLAR